MKLFLILIFAKMNFLYAKEDSKTINLFDGETLNGWYGDSKFWSVQDGALTGTTTKENPTHGNTFLIYTGSNKENTPVEFSDFTLTFKFRIENHNSGLQYRSYINQSAPDTWRVSGYQADFDSENRMTGSIYGENFGRALSGLAQETSSSEWKSTPNHNNKKLSTIRAVLDRKNFAKAQDLRKSMRLYPEWNTMTITAKGFTFTQSVNGKTTSIFHDNNLEKRREKGLIAIQLHGGPPMKVQVKEIAITPVVTKKQP